MVTLSRQPSDRDTLLALGGLTAFFAVVTAAAVVLLPLMVAAVPGLLASIFGLFFLWALLGLPIG